MPINLGSSALTAVKLGTADISKVYLGTALVYEASVTPAGDRIFIISSSDNLIKELSLTDYSVINTSSSTYATSFGLGGLGENRLFQTTSTTTTNINEIDVDSLTTIGNFTTPDSVVGIEGTATRLFRGRTINVRELDTTTLADINLSASIRSLGRDLGGTETRLYSIQDVSTNVNALQEIDVDALTVINTANKPSGSDTVTTGIGGISNRLWSTDSTTDLIYELDLDTMASIDTEPYTNPLGFGGTKTTTP